MILLAAATLVCALGQRPAVVVRVIDGDTVVMRLSLGFETQVEGSCRLAGIDAPELPTTEGVSSANYLRLRLPPGKEVCFQGDKREKYGRPLVIIVDQAGNINDALVDGKYAVRSP